MQWNAARKVADRRSVRPAGIVLVPLLQVSDLFGDSLLWKALLISKLLVICCCAG